MNSAAIAAFSNRAALEISDTLGGTQISINGGAAFTAYVTLPQPTMDLEMGGFNTDRMVKVRWPYVRAPRPAVGSRLLLIADNVSYRVETSTALPGSPLRTEVHVTAIRE